MSTLPTLPTPSVEARAASDALHAHICTEISQAGGWISFARYMQLALYTPGLGYYAGGATRFGEAGDFITAPGLGSLFAQTFAQAITPLIQQGLHQVLEFGAGTGAFAAALLLELEHTQALPARYLILEPSAALIAEQRQTLTQHAPHLVQRCMWLDRLPQLSDTVIIANEVLDALPVEAVRWDDTGIFSRGVSVDQQGTLCWSLRPASATLLQGAQRMTVPTPYESELGLQAEAWIHSLGESLQRGVIFLIDYGFAAQEFWHPQRNTGTLMCHYRHHAHTDPFYLPGLQDITAHIDFSACARAAQAVGLDILGYTTQASFLIDAGLLNVLARTDPNDTRYPALAGQAQRLLSPAEMGELFKVLCLGRAMTAPPGFGRGDRSHTL